MENRWVSCRFFPLDQSLEPWKIYGTSMVSCRFFPLDQSLEPVEPTRLVLVLGSAVTRYRYTEPCELGDAGGSQVRAVGPGFGWWLGGLVAGYIKNDILLDITGILLGYSWILLAGILL